MATVSTRLVQGGPEHKTEITLDWTGVTQEQLKEWAGRTVIISWQRVARDAGKIPPKEHVKVKEFMEGKGRPEKQVTPEKILGAVEKMDPKAAVDLLARLQAQVAKSGSAHLPGRPRTPAPGTPVK